ncbi:hypothetical protein BDY17DRAFT_307847 [Neohortaea acidophila]|uniref:Uncharacterized protein n=1 Tax=Neohortaea acidophila TaxID=245834 RepID=A0A6A6Q273_9PEZI|nr:uncharacterized protein BDY17DRAFT_307847 [Neohortaea acidophila]KAF2486352.1 hypothetical protein BDY17DRAFT_307847 [Neohortaea acidophila]
MSNVFRGTTPPTPQWTAVNQTAEETEAMDVPMLDADDANNSITDETANDTLNESALARRHAFLEMYIQDATEEDDVLGLRRLFTTRAAPTAATQEADEAIDMGSDDDGEEEDPAPAPTANAVLFPTVAAYGGGITASDNQIFSDERRLKGAGILQVAAKYTVKRMTELVNARNHLGNLTENAVSSRLYSAITSEAKRQGRPRAELKKEFDELRIANGVYKQRFSGRNMKAKGKKESAGDQQEEGEEEDADEE